VNNFISEGVAPNTFESNNNLEGEPPHPVSVSEGASHDNPMQSDHSPVIEPPGIIDEQTKIRVISNIFIPTLFWIVGKLMRCTLQK
jgi:hypothetical protein